MHYHLKVTTLVHLGITAEEQDTPQEIMVEVFFEFDAAQAAKTDNITDTLNYQDLYDTIKDTTASGRWDLLEALHATLLQNLSASSPEAKKLTLKITKQPWEDGQITIG